MIDSWTNRFMGKLLYWLIDCFFNWSLELLIGWLTDDMIDILLYWSVESFIDGLINSLVGWLLDGSNGWIIDLLICWLINLLMSSHIDFLISSLMCWLFHCCRSADRYGFYETIDTEDEDALQTYSERLDEKSSDNTVSALSC